MNQFNYADFLDRLGQQSLSSDETFLETYSFIDLLLREVMSENELSFNTSRARFLYIVEEQELGSGFKKAGSLVFTLHFKVFDSKYKVSETEKNLAIYVFQELYNYFSSKRINILGEEQKAEIYKYLEAQNIPKNVNNAKLDCYLKEIKEAKTRFGYPLYNILATDDFGDDTVVYLWLETQSPPFHKRYDHIVDFFTVGRKIRFFNLSWSEKGYFFQNPATSFVIEPDFLIDISSVAECFQQNDILPEVFFLKYIQESEFNSVILKGSFINDLLDAVISEKEIDLNQEFRILLKKQFLKSLDFSEAELNSILQEVNDIHLKNLLQVARFYKDKKITLEPSFISEEYGLQGRLDALVEYPDDLNHKAIFELKSGSPPSQNLWASHYAQVLGYNLLLNSVFKGHRRGHSSILYSKATSNPMRNITPSQTAFSQIMMCRNIIVNGLMRLASENSEARGEELGVWSIELPNILTGKQFQSKSQIAMEGVGGGEFISKLPSFFQSDLKGFFNIYHSLEEYEKTYLNTMISFVMKEFIAQKIGYIDHFSVIRHGYSALWCLSFAEKIKKKNILCYLKFHTFDGKWFHFEYEGESDLGGFREGDLLLIYPAITITSSQTDKNITKLAPLTKDKWGGKGGAIFSFSSMDDVTTEIDSVIADPLSVPIFKATIKKITQNNLCVSFRNALLTEKDLSSHKYYFAEKGILETGHYGNIASIIKFFSIDKHKREVFFGLKEPRFCSIPCSLAQDGYDQIMQKAANFQDYLLIQGPPGTGKTSRYLISIIKQHLQQKDSPVVVLSFTNKALEEISNRLLENEMNFILLGTAQIEKEFHISSLLQNENHGSIFEELNAIKQKISESRIFLSTVANFQNEGTYLKKYIKTDLLIVDEASQLLENQLIGIIAYFDRFILIGDHFQLPAVSTQNITKLSSDLTETIGIRNLQESLFERLHRRCVEKGWSNAYDLLKEHYRMHKEIDELINPFYDYKLKAFCQRQFEKFDVYDSTINDHQLKLDKRVMFFPTKEKTNSRQNNEEAQKTIEIIKTIKSSSTDMTIGVICAWKLQVNLISSMLSEIPDAHLITVDTVERFQGSERDIIIYSTAVSNPEMINNIQSLTSDGKVDRKLNVAISRAKEQFILLGDKEVLSISPHYKRVIDQIMLYSHPY